MANPRRTPGRDPVGVHVTRRLVALSAAVVAGATAVLVALLVLA